jgi:superoxide reductase
MPRISKYSDIKKPDNQLQQDYFDRHTPYIECASEVEEGKVLKVKVKMGSEFVHPDEGAHHISYIQLWDREVLLAETRYFAGALGNKPGHVEVEFSIVPLVSMCLTAMSYCTKHGLWQSEAMHVKVIHPEQ